MAVYSGPNIVTDGIVLHLDKYNEESYLGEPTTNIVPNGDFASYTGGLPSGWSAYNSTAMMTAVTADLPNGKTGTVMQAGPTWPTGSVCGVQANLGARTSGQTETVSFWYRILNTNAGTGNFWCGIWDYPDTRDIYFNTSTNTDWTYFSKAFTLTTDNSTRYYRFLTSDSSNLTGTGFTLQLWNVQYEANSHATKFVDGTRSATNGWRDLSGNDNHADLTSLTYSATNVPNTNVNDFSFNGTDDRVISDNHSIISDIRGDFSVGMWLKFGGTSSSHHIPFWISDSNGNGFVYIELGSNFGYLGVATETKARNGYVSGANINDNNWHYIVVTRSTGASVVIYKDGTSQTVTTHDMYGSWNIGSGGDMSVGVGMENGNIYSSSYYEGNCSFITTYNRVITASEVLRNYNANKGRYGL